VRLEEQKLLVEVTYCGTDREACARLVVDPETFAVREAAWEKYRTPQGAGCKTLNLPQLAGMEAYFNCGGIMREALAPLQDSCANGLFAEAVRGLIQAETFLYKERGFSSAEAYEHNWNSLYVNSCRYYSNLDRVTQGWYEHVGCITRTGSLFNRMKTQVLYLQDNSYLLAGHLNDSFHGVSVELELEKDSFMVKSARGDLLRAPDCVCGEAAGLMKELEGKNLGGIKKKDIARLLGGGNACVHLIDLVSDGLETLELSTEKK
jgi:hypothetical protein